jgi:hypothetical protein
MTSPIGRVEVDCPECGHVYWTTHRPSVNLDLDPHVTNAEIEDWSTGTCPECDCKVELGTLTVRDHGRTWEWRD